MIANLFLIFCSLIASEDRPKHSSTDINKTMKATKSIIALIIVNIILHAPKIIIPNDKKIELTNSFSTEKKKKTISSPTLCFSSRIVVEFIYVFIIFFYFFNRRSSGEKIFCFKIT